MALGPSSPNHTVVCDMLRRFDCDCDRHVLAALTHSAALRSFAVLCVRHRLRIEDLLRSQGALQLGEECYDFGRATLSQQGKYV